MTDLNPMQGVIPHLSMNDQAGSACKFHAAAFGPDHGGMPLPDRQSGLMQAQVPINCAMMMLADHIGDGAKPSASFGRLHLVVADGFTVVTPCERQFRGDDRGLPEDRFGISRLIPQTGAQAGRTAEEQAVA